MLLGVRSLLGFSGFVGLLLLFFSAQSGSPFETIISKTRVPPATAGPTNTSKIFESPEQIPLEATPATKVSPPDSDIANIYNATLGFQKIYVLSMPHRRDKRDVVALAAYLAGLEIEFVDGVNGSEISKAERPEGWEKAFNTDGNIDSSLGCWRGHLDIYQKMALQGVQSALIMEDDVDWDVTIKRQMTEVAHGARQLQHNDAVSHSPYGDDWWLMSTGNCATAIDDNRDQEHWVIDNDPTVVPGRHRQLFYGPKTSPKELKGGNTRLLFWLNYMVCTGSYAISLKGVSNMLLDQQLLPHAKPIDLALAEMCARDEQGKGKCIGIYPPITGIFVPAGDKSKESDRQTSKEGERNDVAWAKNMVYSSRLNMETMLAGSTIVKSQYPDETMLKEINTVSLNLPTGRLVKVMKKEYDELKKEEEKKRKEEERKKKEEEEDKKMGEKAKMDGRRRR